MTNKKKPPKRKGLLAEPLPPLRQQGIIAKYLVRKPGELTEPEKEMLKLEVFKLGLLADTYEISDESNDRYFWLALYLAREYEPGFQQQRDGSGRKTKWYRSEIQALIIDMEKLMVKGNRSKGARWAAEQLAKKEPWKSFIHQGSINPGEALRQRYQSNKRKEVATDGRNLYRELVINGKENIWNEFWRPRVKN